MRKLRAVLAMTAVLTLMIASQSLASAHGFTIYHGNDSVTLGATHRSVLVCDNEADGHYVYAEIYEPLNNITYREADGGDGGCDKETFALEGQWIRLCEESKSCTDWYTL